MSSESWTSAFSQDGAISRVGGFQVGSDTQWWYDQSWVRLVRLVGTVRESDGGRLRD